MSRSFDDSQVAGLNDDILRTVGGGCRFAALSSFHLVDEGCASIKDKPSATIGAMALAPHLLRVLHIWLPLYPLPTALQPLLR
jgi:hypothetical protein